MKHEKNILKNTFVTCARQKFFGYDTKCMIHERKNDDFSFIKTNRIKRLATYWEGLFANYISYKGIIYTIYN